eukprot:TRINITY_DN15094_c0_g1_i1.p1 TRINITY_DN15094_c0_g1~~TRINITY_DN15094_c0_g1_i1.p1  ORF type:complete len:214 (+),score=25.06 TRINITY_DN15094_c0_g1_i1:77-718(+)
MAGNNLVGEPVVVGDDDGIQGPYFNPNFRQSLVAKGKWSDDLFHIGEMSGGCLQTCFCAFCCPCVAIYWNLSRIGTVKTSFGKLTASTYMGIFFCFVVLGMISVVTPPNLYCNTVKDAPLDDEGQPRKTCTTLASVLVQVAAIIFTFLVLKGIREKVRVNEPDWLTFLKSISKPDWCLCCQCCFIVQVTRHVDRLQGFSPAANPNLSEMAPMT